MPVWNISFDSDGHLVDADLIHQQEVRAAKEQRDAQRQAERELIVKRRLDSALNIIRLYSGCIHRSELTSKLVERLGLSRPVIANFISQMLKAGKLFESNKYIMDSQKLVLPI